jgi:cell division septation protein DedD
LFTGNLKSELNAGRKVELPKIGTFHLDSEKNICFEQNRYFNFLLNAYGLSNVQFVPTQKIQEEVEESVTPIVEVEIPIVAIETPIININTSRKSRKLIKYVAAAACFLPIAFYSFWIPVKTNVIQSGVISLNDFNPFYKAEKGVYSPSKTDLKSIKFEDVSYTATPYEEPLSTEIEPTEIVTTSENISNSNPSISVKSSNKRQAFEYIVGCFSSNSNAVNLVNTLKNQGFDATIISGGNLTRVSIGSASNSKSLDSLIQLSNSKGYQGWILK